MDETAENKGNEYINLGETIQLSGFKDVDSGTMIVVKKLVGTQVRKFQDMVNDFERLTLHLKPIHKTEQNMQFEIHADLIHGGKNLNVETLNRNLFMGLSDIFNKFETIIKK